MFYIKSVFYWKKISWVGQFGKTVEMSTKVNHIISVKNIRPILYQIQNSYRKSFIQ